MPCYNENSYCSNSSETNSASVSTLSDYDDEFDAVRGAGAIRPLVTKPENIEDTCGSGGQIIDVLCNYVQVDVPDDAVIHHYSVKFEPEVDCSQLRKTLVKNHLDRFSSAYVFDGRSDLKTLDDIELPHMYFDGHNYDNAVIMITLSKIGLLTFGSFEMIRFLNTQMRRNLTHIGLDLIGRNYFEPEPIGEVDLYGGVQVVQGIQTAINMHDRGLLMMIGTMCKFMRKQSVRKILYILSSQNRDNFQKIARKEIPGSIVITSYNNQTYKIDDIDFGKSPLSTFCREGNEITYFDYYREQYDIIIEDLRQPMLLVLPTARDKRAGRKNAIYLVPELCTMTGITNDMRKDYSFMKDLAYWTKPSPAHRAAKMGDFLRRINSNSSVQEEILPWQIEYNSNLVNIKARILNAPTLQMRDDQSAIKDGDFSRNMSTKRIVSKINLQRWAFVLQEEDQTIAYNLVGEIMRLKEKIGVLVSNPLFYRVEGKTVSDWAQAIDTVRDGAQIIVCVVPNNSKERYDAIKRVTILRKKVPSQVIIGSKTLGRNSTAVTYKLFFQICAKIKGELWRITGVPGSVMVVGYDTYHDSSQKGRSAGGFVASSNSTLTKWFSRVNFHTIREEMSSNLARNIVAALKNWYALNNSLPRGVVVYRDGVGEGNIRYVFEYEVKQIRLALSTIPGGNNIKFTYIIVSKRVNSRFFVRQDKTLINCPTGTVIDQDVTRRDRYDFYLTSQTSRDGTVSPTLFDVIADNSGVSPNAIQNLSYLLTYLYYNWQGSVKVPAPCQYAHKLAYICGQSLHEEHDSSLNNNLWYL